MASWNRVRDGLGRLIERRLATLLCLYPPFVGAGIRVRDEAGDFRRVVVTMPLRRWNRNYHGTHFGGSLYAMCDPFHLLILARALGPDYVVWDKSASVRFRRPGRGTVRAVFEIPAERIAGIRAEADAQPRVEPEFTVDVTDADGTVVATVHKLLHVRRR